MELIALIFIAILCFPLIVFNLLKSIITGRKRNLSKNDWKAGYREK